MCGIFGVIKSDGIKVSANRIASARDSMLHRGPDDAGIFINPDENVGLGHRRLSIIDLSPRANQPMSSHDKRYHIVFNGEIYNYKELMLDVFTQGEIGFKSSSDTEVLLYLYIKHGRECLNLLRGMFAFAIWDELEEELFAARDRFGMKPFYYLNNDAEFIFSSELGAIKHYKKGLTLSMQGMDAFLKGGSVPAPLTIYEETQALPAGHWLRISKGELTIKRYWSFSHLISDETATQSYEEVLHQCRDSLLDSVCAHMVADVEIGAFLSGGIDSSSIVSLMKQTGHDKITTISVIFPGSGIDESNYSLVVAKQYHTNHHEYIFQEKDLELDFYTIIKAMDQPTVDGINTYIVSKVAASLGLKVALAGFGGDELFGGYSSFVRIPQLMRIKSLPFAKLIMKVGGLILRGRIREKAVAYLNNPDAPNSEYRMLRGLFSDRELKVLGWQRSFMHQSYYSDEYDANKEFNEYPAMRTQIGTFDPVNICLMETCNYMRHQILRDNDVFSMAHSLELRLPFVDHLLYGTVLPFINAVFDRKFQKKMLVQATGDLPDEIVHRPKRGFALPLAQLIKHRKEAINDSLTSARMKNYFDERALLNLSENFEKGKVHWSRIWAMHILSHFVE